MKSQTPSTKLSTNPKFQYPMTETCLKFWISVIVICLEFVICYLEFFVFSNTVRIISYGGSVVYTYGVLVGNG